MIKKSSRLRKLERKYCRCLVKVRSKSLYKDKIDNPYGICTNSVYLLKGLKRPKSINCLKNIDSNKLNFRQLKAYSIERKLPIRNKGRFISQKKMLKRFTNTI
jgi:hypothetical protein